MARSRSIGTKLTPEEEKRILAAAEADGKAPSEWARDLLLGGAVHAMRGSCRSWLKMLHTRFMVDASLTSKVVFSGPNSLYQGAFHLPHLSAILKN